MTNPHKKPFADGCGIARCRDDIVRRYWDARARGYAEATVTDADPEETARWRAALEPVLAPLTESPDISVLDVGCGPGLFSLLTAERLPNARITALDGSPGMLAELRAAAASRGFSDRINCVEGDAAGPFHETFDAVISRNVLWNLPEAEKALRNWARALKPGGRMLIADGNHYRHLTSEAYARAAAARPAPRSHHPKYFSGIDPEVMRRVAETLPLTNEDRPAWDKRILADEGLVLESLSASTMPDGAGGEIVADFVLCARKPL